MKKINAISLAACGLLLSSSVAFGANSVDSAFKEGKVSGALTAYGTSTDNKDGSADAAFTSGAISLGFETAAVKGFSAKAGFIGVHEFSEKNDNDASDIASKSLMTEAYVKYANDMFSLTAGRQAVDLEWMGDFHEAVVAAITAVPDTTIVLGYTDKMAVAGVDEVSANFAGDWTGDGVKDNGAYVADVKYTGLKSIEVNPYAYSVPDVANWYGLKGTFTADMFGALAHYAASNEEVVGTNDGSMAAVELNTTLAGISAAVGYIKTGKDNGIGSMAAVGDNYVPFDSGDAIYLTDAKMTYGSLGYTIADVELGALYGVTTYGAADFKEKELNLTAGYSFTDSLSTSVLFANVDAAEADTVNNLVDRDYVLATVEYTF